MALGKPKTAEEYVVKELLETKEELERTKQRVNTLQEDVNDFCEDFLKLHDFFKVEVTTTGTELKVVFKDDPSNKYCSGDTLAFSGSLEPRKFNEKFKTLIQLLKLTAEAEDLAEETLINLKTE